MGEGDRGAGVFEQAGFFDGGDAGRRARGCREVSRGVAGYGEWLSRARSTPRRAVSYGVVAHQKRLAPAFMQENGGLRITIPINPYSNIWGMGNGVYVPHIYIPHIFFSM